METHATIGLHNRWDDVALLITESFKLGKKNVSAGLKYLNTLPTGEVSLTRENRRTPLIVSAITTQHTELTPIPHPTPRTHYYTHAVNRGAIDP